MERHSDNAELVVQALLKHPKVAKVYYPGLPEHPGHEIAAKQMRRFGGMVSFSHVDGEQAALDVAARTKLFILAESLGGIESLIEHPGKMTHASTAGSTLQVPHGPAAPLGRHRRRHRPGRRPADRARLTS